MKIFGLEYFSLCGISSLKVMCYMYVCCVSVSDYEGVAESLLCWLQVQSGV